MPIRIDSQADNEIETVAWLCDDVWELPAQIEALEKWLLETGNKFVKGSYVADIGYSPRRGAAGGGGIVSLSAMNVMVHIGMELSLSEYSPFV